MIFNVKHTALEEGEELRDVLAAQPLNRFSHDLRG